MRIYEELFVVRPDTPDEELDPLIEHLKQAITVGGGSVDNVDKWGVRKFAYRVQKLNEGKYTLIVFKANPDAVKELERRLRVSDLVLKFLTVRIDEKLKRIEKRKKAREKRAARKPVAPPPQAPLVAPGAPSEPHAAVPGTPAPAIPAAPAPQAAPAAPPVPVEAAHAAPPAAVPTDVTPKEGVTPAAE